MYSYSKLELSDTSRSKFDTLVPLHFLQHVKVREIFHFLILVVRQNYLFACEIRIEFSGKSVGRILLSTKRIGVF